MVIRAKKNNDYKKKNLYKSKWIKGKKVLFYKNKKYDKRFIYYKPLKKKKKKYYNCALLKLSKSFNNLFLTLKGFYRKFLISKSAAMIIGN
jgi:hypothetical protein